jgi:spore photoproduct lyase
MRVKKVIIENGAWQYRQTEAIISKFNNTSIERETSETSSAMRDMPLDMDKETLRLVAFKGEFLKPCPGTKEYICCGYQILNVGTNCPLNCSYCILQAYVNQPSMRIFVNLEEGLNTVAKQIDLNPEKIFRIGTGELTDSLAMDHIAGWSTILPVFIKNRKNVVLEFKTKTDNIDGLLSSPFRERIIVSWSLNSIEISKREEHSAPSIIKRLKAAKKCQEEGFITGFHFDPLIYYNDWKNGYLKTVELMDKYLDPKKVIWISMGCMRFIPVLKTIIRKRHDSSHILDGEFINGLDGKKRYFKPLRIEIYSMIKEYFDKWNKDLGLYLCMESSDVWLNSMGWSPGNSDGLSDFLDDRVIEKF